MRIDLRGKIKVDSGQYGSFLVACSILPGRRRGRLIEGVSPVLEDRIPSRGDLLPARPIKDGFTHQHGRWNTYHRKQPRQDRYERHGRRVPAPTPESPGGDRRRGGRRHNGRYRRYCDGMTHPQY